MTKWIAWRKDVGAIMPTPNPKWDPNAKEKPQKGVAMIEE
jgi:hypothetical protein